MKKSFWGFLSQTMEFAKLQTTTYKGPQGHVTIIVQVIRTFLLDLKCR